MLLLALAALWSAPLMFVFIRNSSLCARLPIRKMNTGVYDERAESEGRVGPVESPRIDFTQEIRFAVVMYGGISLAIYMNGVAQELLKLVRATAPAPHANGEQRPALRPEELRSTEIVYRKLGQILSRSGEVGDPKTVRPGDTIQTRFVIDVLSGSSAGGINAVYLAKALVNDQPLEDLKELWEKEGDIELLINDRNSKKGTRLRTQNPPRSLLNGRRMYWKLLDALESMDKGRQLTGRQSPNVEELDLYVTATDMRGQLVKLQLSDKLVEELRHRNVFHFRYSTHEYGQDGAEEVRNDFVAAYNPFLAYAARCTSAHPAAFEPMRLGDIDEVLRTHRSYRGKPGVRSGAKEWRIFYKEHLRGAKDEEELSRLAEGFVNRVFNDGGVLDNRPFSYATDAIPRHLARRPVDRKLVYIDPAPEDPILRDPSGEGEVSPSIVENAWLSLSTLPRYEPIREDLQRVLERNRLIDRLSVIIKDVESSVMKLTASVERSDRSVVVHTDEDWDEKTLTEMSREKGLAWGSYQRLRVAEVTDDLARLIVRAAGLNEDSGEFLAVRALVRHWRKSHYDPEKEGNKRSEHEFLRRFDFLWRLRRLKFVLAKIDEMLSAPYDDVRDVVAFATWRNLEHKDLAAFREELWCIRKEFYEIDETLRESRKYLWEARRNHPLGKLVKAIGFERQDLKELEDLLKPRRDEDHRIEAVFTKKRVEFERFGEVVRRCVGRAFRGVSRDSRKVLLSDMPIDVSATIERTARDTVRFYYDTFNNYDMVAYPAVYAAGIGEEMAPVEVFRVSPKDAWSLIDEDDLGGPKLAGTTLNNFGAFFERKFRLNDILWGQLDGAERIISALLPNEEDLPKRDQLIREAHQIIVAEEVLAKEGKFKDKAEVHRWLKETLADTGLGEGEGEAAGAFADPPDHLKDSPLRAHLKPSGLLADFEANYKKDYETNRRFDNESMVRNVARATRVFGRLLEGYSQTQRHLPDKGVLWVTRLTQLFWSLVEVAVPQSMLNLMWRYWMKLLYLFEVLLVIFGVVLSSSTVWRIGVVAFVITVAVHAIVLLLGDVMGGKGRWWRAIGRILAGILSFVFVIGIVLILAVLGVWEFDHWVEFLLDLRQTP